MDSLDYRKLDSIFHSRIRLAVVAALVKAGTLDFSELKTLTGATEGNLATHLRKLEVSEYVLMEKGFRGRRPRTTYTITESGLRGFKKYVDALASFIDTGDSTGKEKDS